MYILSQDGDFLANLDNMSAIAVEDIYDGICIKIWFVGAENDDFGLGEYNTKEEAMRVYEEILNFIAEPNKARNRIFRIPPSTTGDYERR